VSLGAETVESIDYSNYEQASIIHDLNLPIDENLKEKFSTVVDGGTLEHIFNYPVAIKNCMEMVKIGGHLILMTPANNYFGHGFYQFSPELFFSLLSEQNGFEDTQVFQQNDSLQWFKIQNPKDIKCRVDEPCAKNNPSLICVVSKKTKTTPVKLRVLQSDYELLWQDQNLSNSWVAKNPFLLFIKDRFSENHIIRLLVQFRKRRIKKKIFYTKVNMD
jgi:hypothetical protein